MCTSGFHDSTCKSCEGDRWCESGSNLEKTCDHVREPTTPPRLSQRSGGVIYLPADLPVGTRRRRRPLTTASPHNSFATGGALYSSPADAADERRRTPGIDDELGPLLMADVLKLPGRRDRLPHPPFAAATRRDKNDVLHSPR